jgi:hypothetical protein
VKVSELSPIPAERLLFKLSSLKIVPAAPGCYVLATFDGEILYVGQSVSLNQRFRSHMDNLEKTSLTPRGKAFWFHFLSDESGNLDKLERTWLNEYLTMHAEFPILNKVDSPLS